MKTLLLPPNAQSVKDRGSSIAKSAKRQVRSHAIGVALKAFSNVSLAVVQGFTSRKNPAQGAVEAAILLAATEELLALVTHVEAKGILINSTATGVQVLAD